MSEGFHLRARDLSYYFLSLSASLIRLPVLWSPLLGKCIIALSYAPLIDYTFILHLYSVSTKIGKRQILISIIYYKIGPYYN